MSYESDDGSNSASEGGGVLCLFHTAGLVQQFVSVVCVSVVSDRNSRRRGKCIGKLLCPTNNNKNKQDW